LFILLSNVQFLLLNSLILGHIICSSPDVAMDNNYYKYRTESWFTQIPIDVIDMMPYRRS